MNRFLAILPLTLLAAACAGGAYAPPEPPPPPELNPIGVYDCALDIEGQQMSAVLTISESAEGYTGTVDSDMGPAPVADITVDGQEMTFVVDTGDMSVFFAVVFDGDDFRGDFDAGGMGGYISGTKR